MELLVGWLALAAIVLGIGLFAVGATRYQGRAMPAWLAGASTASFGLGSGAATLFAFGQPLGLVPTLLPTG